LPPLSYPTSICQAACDAKQRGKTVTILNSIKMRMAPLGATSLLCLEEPGGGPQRHWCPSHLHERWEFWVALGVPAFPSVYLWVGSNPMSENTGFAAVNEPRDDLPHKGAMSLSK